MHRNIQIVIVLLGLTAVGTVAAVLLRREQRSTATEQALRRGLQPGMRLEEATALLRRLEVLFTVDSTAEGTAIVKYGRKEARDSRISRVSEQQLVFDREGRLRNMLTAAQISSP